MWRQIGGIVLVAMVIMACSGQTSPDGNGPNIRAAIISVSQLPKRLDEGHVYEYMYSQVNAESLLSKMWSAGIPISQAWLPLDNHCMDPRGPRFTVELTKADPRIEDFNFTKGSGRLSCATMLKRFFISG